MAGTRTLKVEIVGDAKSAASAFKEVSGHATSFGSVMKGAVAGTAVAAVLAFGVKAAEQFKSVGTEVLRLQRYTGGTAESMSGLRFAAQQSGVDIDVLTKSLGLLSKNIIAGKVDAEKIGVQFKDTAGQVRPLNDVLLDLAGKFQSMQNGAEKTALAQQLFGRAGAALIPLLNKGKEGLAELEAEAKKYGVELTQGNLVAIKANIVAHREHTAAMQGLSITIGQYVLPLMTKLETALTGGVEKTVEAIRFVQDHKEAQIALAAVLATAVLPTLAKATIAAAEFGLALTGAAIEGVVGVLDGLAAGFAGVAVAEDVATASALGFEVAIAGPLLIVVGAVALAAAAFKVFGHEAEYSGKQAEAAGKAFGRDFAQNLTGTSDEVQQLTAEIEILKKKQGDAAVTAYVQGQATNEVSDSFVNAKAASDELKTRLAELSAAQEAHTQALDAAGPKINEFAESVGKTSGYVQSLAGYLGIDLAKATEKEYTKLTNAVSAIDATSTASQALATAQGTLANRFSTATEKASAFNTVIDEIFGQFVNVPQAVLNVEAGIDNLTKSLKENGATFDVNTEKGRNNQSALLSLTSDVKNHAEAVYRQTRSVKAASDALSVDEEHLLANAKAAGATKQEIAFLKAAFDSINQTFQATVVVDGVQQAIQDTAKVLDNLKSIDTKQANRIAGANAPDRTNTAYTGGSSTSVTVNVQTNADPKQVADETAWAIKKGQA